MSNVKPQEEVKNPVGRPTKYDPIRTIEICLEYLDFDLFETYSKEIVVKDQVQVINLERPNSIPSIAGLARHLNVSRETIYDWGKKFKEFSDILEALYIKQEEFLLYHGLTKGYDSGFAKFITQNVTKYREKVEHVVDDETKNTIQLAYQLKVKGS